jgi:hypothetical protein
MKKVDASMRTVINFSSVHSAEFDKVIGETAMVLKDYTWNTKSTFEKDIGAFTWSVAPENDQDQRDNYMTHLNQISWPFGYEIADGSSNTFHAEVIRSKFVGSIDVVLVPVGERATFHEGIRLGIELKKKKKKKTATAKLADVRQASIEHICAAVINNDQTMLSMLTDLNTMWMFIYFGHGRTFHRVVTTRNQAVFLLENIFNDKVEGIEFPVNFSDRLSWRDFLNSSHISSVYHQQGSDGNNDNEKYGGSNHSDSDVSEEHQGQTQKPRPINEGGPSGKGDGAGQSVTLRYNCDVANELDLLDFIENEEEKRQIVFKYVLENVVPHIVWEGDTKGIDIASLAEEKEGWLTASHDCVALPLCNGGVDMSDDELFSTKDDHFVALSEENLSQHNARRGQKISYTHQ